MKSLFSQLLRYVDQFGRGRDGGRDHSRAARGRRRLAVQVLEDRLTPSGETFSTVPFTLPAGRGATIKFDATIDSPLTKGITTVYNQGTVSGGTFDAFRTDDPSQPGATDPTPLAVDRAPAG